MRCTSEVNDVSFPYADDRVPFILVATGITDETKDGRGFEHASTAKKKIELLEEAKGFEDRGYPVVVLASWPGAKRTDVFHVDDLDEALAAF